ncbi:hypothetical protein G7Y89_g15558 [Cudoniella acicularis]|uniref:Uncharacterized protein n=1 Tax=Cudoniella acicularis TaxID=354080 RepID=A0A8H4QKP2_9HELO|nr:hypothetical protein G7Y89_g15558 [Cudoniella acicularis]
MDTFIRFNTRFLPPSRDQTSTPLGSFLLPEHDARAPVAGWSPAPTQKPAGFLRVPELLKRQTSSGTSFEISSYSVSLAIDGYLNEESAQYVVCAGGSLPFLDAGLPGWACCGAGSSCQMFTSCVPQVSLASCANENSCDSNNFVLKCDASYPYCHVEVLIGAAAQPLTDYFCATVPSTRTLFASATDGTSPHATYYYTSVSVPATITSSPTVLIRQPS